MHPVRRVPFYLKIEMQNWLDACLDQTSNEFFRNGRSGGRFENQPGSLKRSEFGDPKFEISRLIMVIVLKVMKAKSFFHVIHPVNKLPYLKRAINMPK